jgi:RHS repeat-associated protein
MSIRVPAKVGVAIGLVAALASIALASPGDPFTVALPGRDTSPPEGLTATGAADVSAQQGAATYAYPIAVPPGRGGMTPHLSLSYSSSGALRGGLAVGWSLDLPSIERDPRLLADHRYGGQLLIASQGDLGTGVVFRPLVDRGGMTRLEKAGTSWIARTPDGIARTFTGDGSSRWNLASERDAFGNTVTYNWTTVGSIDGHVDYVLQSIDYGANAGAGLAAYARVELTWVTDTCPGALVPIGARTDGHFGRLRMFGAQRLAQLKTRVRDTSSSPYRDVRRYVFHYDDAELGCASSHSPLRYLTRIDTTAIDAYNVAAYAPPVTFTYGATARELTATQVSDTIGLGERGTNHGPDGQLMDFDGDGINDQVRVTMPAYLSQGGCRLFWRKGLFGGGFANATESWLPSAAWAGIGNIPVSALDACTLNGQFATRNTFVYGDGSHPGCIDAAVEVSYRFLDWDHDGDRDLVVNTSITGGAAVNGDFPHPAAWSASGGGGGGDNGGCPDGTTPAFHLEGGGGGPTHCNCDAGTVPNSDGTGCDPECQPGTVKHSDGSCGPECNNADGCTDGPWNPDHGPGPGGGPPPGPGVEACSNSIDPSIGLRVYYQEAGRFHAEPFLSDGSPSVRAVQTPVPLPPNGGELQMMPSLTPMMPGLPTLVDVTGDGVLDLVTLDDAPYTANAGEQTLSVATHLNVYPGLTNGTGFLGRQQWPLPQWAPVSNSATTNLAGDVVRLTQAGELTDLDGDGLPDLVVQVANTDPADTGIPRLYVAYNLQGAFGPLQPLGVRSQTGAQRVEMPGDWSSTSSFDVGWRGDQRAITDLDRDGLPDLVVLLTDSSDGVAAPALARTIVHLGTGSIVGGVFPASFEPIERLVHAVNRQAWYRQSDFVDLTGDGRPDAVTFDGRGRATIQTDAPGSAPERVLTAIDNGRGAHTTFTYGVTTDPAIAAPSSGLNEPRWVVTAIAVEPGSGQPAMRTTYHYGAPVFGRERTDDVEPHFLGFASATTDHSGQLGDASARTVETFSYDHDPAGHLLTTWTYRADPFKPMLPVRFESATWTSAPLADGRATFLYRDTDVLRTCDLGASEAQCAVEAENVLTQHELWMAYPGFAGPVLYEQTQSNSSQPDTGGGASTRITIRTFQTRIGQTPYAAGDYRILQTGDELRETPTGPALARTNTIYDASGLPTDDYVYTTGTTSGAAHTIRTFDAQTGAVLTVKRPNAVVSGGLPASTDYDANRLFVAKSSDELGHVITEQHDLGTGALIRREGPNKRTWSLKCANPPCAVITALQPEEWSVDGYGRVTEHRVATDPPTGTNGYALAAIEKVAYDDAHVPNRRTSAALRDLGGGVWLVGIDQYDGIGRVIEHDQHRTANEPEIITRYGYDAGGALLAIQSPDPRDDAAFVTTTYARDGVGRVTAMSRPDGTTQLVAYLGLTRQVQDVATEGLGPMTRLDHDPFGRLYAVHEPDGVDGTADHVTHYVYDAADRIGKIVDADGTATAMSYDVAGHRKTIKRGGQTWQYVYDADGNLTDAVSPMPIGATASLYTSKSAYDELDRQISHTPATHGMSAPAMADLGIGTISTKYDGAANGVGAPSKITLPFGTITYAYDVRGRVSRETRKLSLGHGITESITQSVDRTYNAAGAPVDVTFDDGTSWGTTYDARGLVGQVRWHASSGDVVVAKYERRFAGVPWRRTNAYAQQRDWTYDALGRVVRDQLSQGPTFWIDRTYGYDGFGRLAAVTGAIDGHDAGADYDFDARGRLANVYMAAGYQASLAYSPAGNVTRATVVGALDAPKRDVLYQYGAADPQAVDKLVGVGGGPPVALLGYDLSGNLVTRTVEGVTSSITVDGDDRIRKVAGPQGTETYFFGSGGERVASFGPDGVKLWFGESETHLFSNGVLDRRWVHVGAGEPLARIEKVGSAAPTIELQYADALQNLVLTLSATGAVTSSFLYGGFGELVWESGEKSHRRQFNGKEADLISGLRHYGYRSYDPVLLRWTAADPMYRFGPDAAWDEPQRANLYAFSLNNPLNYYDPDGRDDHDIINNVAEDVGRRFEDWLDDAEVRIAALPVKVLESVALTAGGMLGDNPVNCEGSVSSCHSKTVTEEAQAYGEGALLVTPFPEATAAADTAAGAKSIWKADKFERGLAIEEKLGGNLPKNFKTFDKFEEGSATSIKSLDLDAKSYQSSSKVYSRVKKYVCEIDKFNGAKLSGVQIMPGDIQARALDLAVPHLGSEAQQAGLRRATEYAESLNIKVNLWVVQ